MNNLKLDPYGVWIVTTEGDVEGKSTRHLGAFTGFIDEIALHLADKCYYSLDFKRADTETVFTPTRSSVDVTLNGYNKEQIKVMFNHGPLKLNNLSDGKVNISLNDTNAGDQLQLNMIYNKLTASEKEFLKKKLK